MSTKNEGKRTFKVSRTFLEAMAIRRLYNIMLRQANGNRTNTSSAVGSRSFLSFFSPEFRFPSDTCIQLRCLCLKEGKTGVVRLGNNDGRGRLDGECVERLGGRCTCRYVCFTLYICVSPPPSLQKILNSLLVVRPLLPPTAWPSWVGIFDVTAGMGGYSSFQDKGEKTTFFKFRGCADRQCWT